MSKKTLGRVIPLIFAVVLILCFAPMAIASVYDYNINSAVLTGVGEITVEVQANYCAGCDPNDDNEPGCTPFENYPDSYGCNHYGGGDYYPNGRYCDIRLTDSPDLSTAIILAEEKRILNQTNWPIASVQKNQFVFSDLSLQAGDYVTVFADCYCGWCGHWYPAPKTVEIIASNSQVTYTGDTTAPEGTGSANVSATLVDSATQAPLAGKTVTFTLDGLAPVSATTDSNGVASTTIDISSLTVGTYQTVTDFAGDQDYYGCGDKDDFIVTQGTTEAAIDIKPGGCPNSINLMNLGNIPVAVIGSNTFDVSLIDSGSICLEGISALEIGGGLEDVNGDGYLDIVFHFSTLDLVTALTGKTEATLTGTIGGHNFEGSDSVRIIDK